MNNRYSTIRRYHSRSKALGLSRQQCNFLRGCIECSENVGLGLVRIERCSPDGKLPTRLCMKVLQVGIEGLAPG